MKCWPSPDEISALGAADAGDYILTLQAAGANEYEHFLLGHEDRRAGLKVDG